MKRDCARYSAENMLQFEVVYLRIRSARSPWLVIRIKFNTKTSYNTVSCSEQMVTFTFYETAKRTYLCWPSGESKVINFIKNKHISMWKLNTQILAIFQKRLYWLIIIYCHTIIANESVNHISKYFTFTIDLFFHRIRFTQFKLEITLLWFVLSF